jgi:prespore-specific regulator
MKVRQDAWSHEDDLLLAETVLRHIREGGTQLQAFEEVGDHLNRTSAACGFRWNAVVRKKYEQAISLAKKQRKERKRALAKQQASMREAQSFKEQQNNFPAFEFGEEYVPFSERKSHLKEEEQEVQQQPINSIESQDERLISNNTFEQSFNQNSMPQQNQQLTNSNIDLEQVISFLQTLNQSNHSTQKLQLENERLKNELQMLQNENNQLKRKINHIEQEHDTIQDDYQSFLKIIDRARKMVVLNDDEELPATSFRMDKNGNLEKIAK